ncbi:DUF6313 family protein [Streptomyces sp. NPDC005248]|uniref:DUF6313 family protein n=1 Tax=Streptomyces sp. NPDC005248 TaxID=3364709 RepID=UPI0036745FE3
MSSASAPPTGGPPPPGRRQRLRARWSDRHALPRFAFWLLSRGTVVLAVCAGLYVLNGFLIGWANAYDVITGITSPAATRPQWCAWPLSLAGWAAIPAIIGAAAGYVITEQIQAHHARDLSDVLDELRRRTSGPAPLPRERLVITLHEVHEQGSEAVKAAVLAFGARHPLNGLSAEPDWGWAEKHFTSLIETIMGTAAPLQDSAAATVHRAKNEAIGFLLAVNTRPDYHCPICVKRQRHPL